MQIFSWSRASNAGALTPFVWVDRERAPNPAIAAEGALAELKSRPAGKRCLFFFHAFPGIWKISAYDFAKNALAIESHQDWYNRFFQRLNLASIVPDRIVFDEEDSLSVWHLFGGMSCGPERVNVMRPIWQDAALLATLPASLRAVRVDDFQCHTGPGHNAYTQWNQYAAARANASLKRIVFDTAQNAFLHAIPTSNYGDMFLAFRVYDVNDWEVDPPGSGLGNWASPVVYGSGDGQRYAKFQHDARWNRLVDALNMVRSCLAYGADVAPWVSSPEWRGDQPTGSVASGQWWWREAMRHLRHSGIDVFLYWNATVPSSDFADPVFAELAKIELPSAPVKLPPLSNDCDVIQTGEYKTLYTDYLRARDGKALPS